MTSIVLGKHTHIPIKEPQVMIKAGIRMVGPHTKKCQDSWQPSEAKREAQNRLSLGALQREPNLPIP